MSVQSSGGSRDKEEETRHRVSILNTEHRILNTHITLNRKGRSMIKEITLTWPSVIEFGAGRLEKLKDHLSGNKRIYFLCDPPIKAKIEPLLAELRDGFEVEISTDVVPEPPFEALEKLLEPVRVFSPDAIVGVGGGSAMDLAKLVSVLFTGEQKTEEIIGIGQVKDRKVKLFTVSTTSGTGSEVTPIAVLTDTAQKLKKGVVSKFIIPDVAIVDPELTTTLPPAITASTGMDAMTHCIEAFTNRHSHPIIDNLALEGIRLIAQNLETAVKSGNDLDARTAMALGSLYGGLCLGPVNTAAVHAMAYPLGGEFKIPHGVSNSVLLPFVMSFNLPSCVEKYAQVAHVVGVSPEGSNEDMARKGILKIRDISERCGIPSGIRDLHIPESAIPSMAEAALKVKRLMENNPRTVALGDAEAIFRQAYRGVIE